MTLVDGVAVGVVFISTVVGVVRGITREVLSLFAWSGAIASTWMCWPLARHFFEQWIENPMLAGGATIIALFLLFLILFSLISYFLSNLVRQSWMGGVDRALGSLFGVVRGATLLCFFELGMAMFIPRGQYPAWLSEANCAPLLYQGSDLLYQILPSRLHLAVEEQRAKIQPTLQGTAAAVATTAVQAGIHAAQTSVHTHSPANIENMARLNPKRIPVQEGYSKKQRQEMDRLLSQESAAPTLSPSHPETPQVQDQANPQALPAG